MSDSFSCQICGMDMATARIRTPDEPPSAAWNWRGVNYVGFSKFLDYNGEEFPDRECQECTTADRTPAEICTAEYSNLWPEHEDEDDAEWLPNDESLDDSEPLEYDSDAEGSDGNSSRSSNDGPSHSSNDQSWHDDTDTRYLLAEIYKPVHPERQPHGTWRDGLIFYRGPESRHNVSTMEWAFQGPRAPPEHIASPSCQSLQGINGHVLGVAEMKNCRTHRFLLPKPLRWKSAEATDKLLEDASLFYLSGESNGSDAFMYRYFYPPRHGLHEMIVSCDFLNFDEGYDTVHPIPVHSYCLDIYAKVSYSRLGRVDLDGLFYWRKIQSCPASYGVEELGPLRRKEVERGRTQMDHPWHHLSGDEWLVANPVEIQGIRETLVGCTGGYMEEAQVCRHRSKLLEIPAELLNHVLTFLDFSEVSALADTCRKLYKGSQPFFKAHVTKNMSWLWELFEDDQYPPSPDWPATWDPLCPPGLTPPSLPIGLESKEDEDARWEEIIADDPEMEGVGKAARAFNDLRREEVYGPYRARQEASLRDWQQFRVRVERWIRNISDAGNVQHGLESVDWIRIWRLFNPSTTRFQGVRNRARIWSDCGQILDILKRTHDRGVLDAEREALSTKLSSSVYWSEVHGG